MQTLADKILDDPDDWEAWRVFGDWLIQQGDPRGDMIGLEHKLLSRPIPAAQRAPLVAQLQQLQREHEDRCLSGRKISGMRLQWRAGFILGVELWTWWGDRAHLDFIQAAAESPAGSLFRRLRIKSHCGLKGLATLAASPVLAHVRELVLSDIGMDSGTHDGIPNRHGLDVVLSSPHLQKLTSLDVSENNMNSSARASYSSSSQGGSPLGITPSDDKGEVLARRSGLEALNLRGCYLADDAIASLVGPEARSKLVRLDLGSNKLTAEGAAAIARSEALSELRYLSLRDNPIGLEGLSALASSDRLGALEQLDLSFALPGEGDAATKILIESRGLSNLRALNLRGSGLSSAGLSMLSESAPFQHCQILR